MNKTYDKEFKDEAVQMLLKSKKPLVQVAGELGVSDTSLWNWKMKYLKANERGPRGDGTPAATMAELLAENKRLAKELANVTWQRDILKKATGILSEKSQGGML